MFGETIDARWPPGPKSSGEYRIVMIGGSTVAQGDPPLPAVLEKVFEEKGFEGVKVYNLGIVSQKSAQELAQLVFTVVDAKPDLVIVYDGGNDIMDPVYEDPRPNFPMDFLVYENNPLSADLQSYPAFSLFAFGSALARYVFDKEFKEKFLHLKQLRRQAGFDSDPWRQRIADAYVGNLIKSRAIAHALGAELVVVFQPIVFFKTPLGPKEARFDPQSRSHAADVRNRIRDRLRRSKRDGVPRFLDLSEVFDGAAEDVFGDYIHVYQKFQRPLAEKIFHALDVRRAAGRPYVKD